LVSTFQRAIGSTEPDHAPEMKAGVPSGFNVTVTGVGGEKRRVTARSRLRRFDR